MSKDKIKQKIHELIDELDDGTVLQMLYEDAVEYKTASHVADDGLTETLWVEIEKGLKQIENGETFTDQQVIQHVKKWRSTK